MPLHKSPWSWGVIAIALLLVLYSSPANATVFLGICLVIDGFGIIVTRKVDLGDWWGGDSDFHAKGITAIAVGVVVLGLGVYLATNAHHIVSHHFP